VNRSEPHRAFGLLVRRSAQVSGRDTLRRGEQLPIAPDVPGRHSRRGGEGHGEGRWYAEWEVVVLTDLTRYYYTPQVPSKYSGPGLGRDGGVSLIAVGPRAKKGGGPKQAGGGRSFEEWGTFNRARVRKVEVPFEGGF
jgi:hypothetical protein